MSINSSSDILSYSWTVTNATILGGQNTEALQYEGVSEGAGTICLEVTTICGNQGPLCKDVTFFENPDPVIDPVDTNCNFIFDLTASTLSSSMLSWSQESGPSTATIVSVNQDETIVEVFSAGTYTFRITETNGPCESIDEITIEIQSALVTEDPIYNCNLDNEYQVTVEILSGVAPYTVNGNNITGNVFISEFIESDDTFTFVITDNDGCSTTIMDQYTCPCISDAGTMSSDEITVCVSDLDEIIAIWNNDGLFDNNDIGMYVIHDESGSALGNVFYSSPDGIFDNLDDLMLGVNYYISYIVGDAISGEVDLNDPCLSVAEGQSFTIFDLPEFSAVLQDSTCSLSIEIDGNLDVDDDITWSYVSGPGSLDISDNSVPTTITASMSGNYSVSAQISNDGCTTTEEIELFYLDGPQLNNPEEVCNSTNDAYQVSIEIIDGNGPYSSSSPGTFNGNTFTTEFINTGEEYQIIITDDFGCESEIISGTKLCDCTTDSGNMDNQLLTICGLDSTIMVSPPADAVFDPDDIGYFVLHDSPGVTLGNVFSTSTDGIFSFTNNMISGTTYYVSHVVGNNLNGIPDIDDPCIDLSRGQPVIWLEYDDIMITDTLVTCDNMVDLIAMPLGGSWRVIETVTGSITDLQLDAGDDNTFSFDQDGTYLLEYSSRGSGCISFDTMTIIKNPIPVIENIQQECADDLASYSLSFSISGSNGPYMVDGISIGSEYMSDALDTSRVYNFIIENEFGCITDFTYGPVQCNCESEVGTIITTPLELCTTESIDISNIPLSNSIIAEGDTLAYVLHDGTASTLGNILSISYGENIEYNNSFITETSYYLSAVVSGHTNGAIDISDPCLSFSEGALVIWIEDTTVNFSEQFDICSNEDVTIYPNITGRFPINLILENELGEELSFDINSASDSLTIINNQTDATWQIKEVNGECVSQANGQISITVTQPQDISFVASPTICNNPMFGSTLILSELFDGGPYLGEWSSDDLLIANGTIDADGLTGGDYTLNFTSVGFEGACPGSESLISITIEECNCPIFTNQDYAYCSNEGPLPLDIFDTAGLQGDWTIDPGQQTPIIENDSLYIADAISGIYNLTFTITQADYPAICSPVVNYEIEIEASVDAGMQTDPLIECSNNDISINLNDLLEGESPSGDWSYNNQPSPPVINLIDLSLGSNLFTYNLTTQGICPSVMSTAEIIIEETPEITVIGEDVLCFGDDNGIITIEHLNGIGASYMYYIDDLLAGTTNVNTNIAPGDYTVYVENDSNCRSETYTVTINEPVPVEVSLGDDLVLDSLEEYKIEAIVNILESDISEISWTDLSGELGIDILELQNIATQDNIIAIEILDENGCVGFDQINVQVIIPDIDISVYIPNIFDPNLPGNNSFYIQTSNSVDPVSIDDMRIFDRWGNNVFVNSNFLSNDPDMGWDGTINDTDAEQGVYVYYIKYNDGSTDVIESGSITLIR